MHRIDRLITPPGLIARARMYSLVLTDAALYVLNTGKAANPTMLYYNGRYRRTAEVLQSGYDTEIREQQNIINSGNFDSMLSNKHSKKYVHDEIKAIAFRENIFKGTYIELITTSKKYKLILPLERNSEAQEFVQHCSHFLNRIS